MRRLPFLDSLRGIAAIYVVFYHMALLPNPKLLLPDWASTFVLTGGTGVTLFFVVSGFSLCYTMPAHDSEHGGALSFYIRRFFRIAPLFYFMMAFYLVRDHFYFKANHGFVDIASSAAFIFNLIPGREDGFVWASWTLGAEMIFYVIFPFLVRRVVAVWSLVALFFGTLLLAAAFHEFLDYVIHDPMVREPFFASSFLRNLPIFVSGILVYRIFAHSAARSALTARAGLALIMISLYGYYALLSGALNVLFVDPYYWQTVIYSIFLLGLSAYPCAVFVNGITRYLGNISYSIYLVHPSAILFLYPIYTRIYALSMPVTAKFLLSAGITLSVVIAVAAITYRYIEKPGMRLGKILLRSLINPSSEAAHV